MPLKWTEIGDTRTEIDSGFDDEPMEEGGKDPQEASLTHWIGGQTQPKSLEALPPSPDRPDRAGWKNEWIGPIAEP